MRISRSICVLERDVFDWAGENWPLRKDGWKFIDCVGSGGFTPPSRLDPVEGGPEGQLYNLDKDPLESTNLYLEGEDKVKELSALLDKLKAEGFNR